MGANDVQLGEERSDEAQRLLAEFDAKLAARTVNATYALATRGAKTRLGGTVVTASSHILIDTENRKSYFSDRPDEGESADGTYLRVACVGDKVRYPDGSVSRIVTGAGSVLTDYDLSVALVGSTTSNGDTIVSTPQNVSVIVEYADEPLNLFTEEA
jgi:uncharacterized Zn-binding protein involved in type VI secretion